MEPFVTRIGDVTIERVVPRSGKEQKESIPAPSVSLAKRGPVGSENETLGDAITVSEDLQIFLKPPVVDSQEVSKFKADTSESVADEDEQDSHDGRKTVSDNAKMLTDEDGCDDDSELEDMKREESDIQSDVNIKINDVNESELRNEETDDKTSDSKDLKTTEILGDNSVASKDEGSDGGTSVNGGDRIESNKRKASLESCGSNGSGQKKKNKKRRTKARSEKDGLSDGSDNSESSSSDSEDLEEEQSKPAVERKVSNLRRNIREVMNESQLDEETLAAQRQEMERLRRVQEQQRIIREVQRQIALNRQNTKTQTRVISLLQGNSSILKQIPGTSSSSATSGSTQVRLPNTVLVKLASGSASNTSTQTKKVYELLRVQKGAAGRGASPNSRAAHVRTVPGKSRGPGQVHMMTPSVSIAPVVSSQNGQQGSESESDIDEGSDKEVTSSGGAKAPGKPKGKDVVTISSSSDDDDCILLSEPSSGDEGDPVDDPTNSGMHTNDIYNVPDEQGRVLVNVGHPPEEPDIFLAPQIARVIKPHQIGGVRFLYDNVVESVERFNTSTGFGCILAHSMGLGKTLQVISFCDVFLRHTKARTVLCIMPINTLQNWLAEFNMWLPDKDPQNSPLAVHGEVRQREFPLHVLNDSHKSMTARSRVIQEWNRDGGVLLIGYELYRQLSLRRTHKSKKKRKKVLEVVDVDEEDKNKLLLDEIHGALVKPGPDLVICDEGHRIKNSHASISQALKQIRSKRRVVLTGYPLQNNLLEYWCMVDFVRPNYLGTKTEFCNMFERPIQNGQCIDSTPQDIRLMRYRAHVLHSLLEGFVQRRSHSVLQVSLPQKEEYVLLLRMTAFQRKLYDTFMNEVVRTKAVPNPLKAFAVCCKIWNHPDVLYYFLKKRSCGEDVDLDLEETTSATTALAPKNGTSPVAPKRGRGRTPRSGSGTKRDKKAAGLQTASGGRKPAATIIPNTTNMNTESSAISMSSGMGCIGHPHGQVTSMGGPSTQIHSSMQHQQNQNFSVVGHQNHSYNRDSGSYHDMSYQNMPQGPNSSYGNHGYNNSGYPQNNSGSNFSGMETHNYGEGHHSSGYGDCNTGNSYYQQGSVRDQQDSYGSYYASNTQQVNNESRFQCNPNNSTYWHNNTSYYQNTHAQENTNPGNRGNQYYGGNNSPHYGNAEQSSYYMNQNQNQNFGGQMNNAMYHGMGAGDGYGNNMGHMHGSRGQQTRMDDSSEQRMRNTQSVMNPPGNQMNVPSHINNAHTQMNSCPQGMQNQNVQNQLMNVNHGQMSSHNQMGNPSNNHSNTLSNIGNQMPNPNQMNNSHNSLGNSPNSLTSSGHCGNPTQMPTGNQINNSPTTGLEKMVQMCSSPNQGRNNTQNQVNNHNSMTNTQKIGNTNHRANNNHIADSQSSVGNCTHLDPQDQLANVHNAMNHNRGRNVQQQVNPLHSSLTNVNQGGNSLVNSDSSLNTLQNTGHINQGMINDMQSPINNIPVQYPNHPNSSGNGEPSGNDQSLFVGPYGHGIQGDGNNTCTSFDSMDQSFSTPSRSCDMKSDMGKLPVTHNDPLCEIGTVYDRFPAKVDKQERSDHWGHNNEMNDPNMPLKCDSSENFENNSDVKTAVKSDLTGNQFSPHTNQNLCKNLADESTGTEKNENENKECDSSSSISHSTSPVNQTNSFQNNQQLENNLKDNSNEEKGRIESNHEINEQSAGDQVNKQMTDIECTSPNSGKNEERKREQELLEESKGSELENKNINNNIETEDMHKETGCGSNEIKNTDIKVEPVSSVSKICGKEDPGIPYDWATELLKNYIPGSIENSAKMEVFFCILEESMALGDRMLVFSQSLFTLNLIEDFLQRTNLPGRQEKWSRNWNYYRLDGSTSALEREKLINEYNSNPNIHLFLVSTRAGSLGINLVGANRVVVFDASWNPCHDTQAVCRVYRYGQKKPCFVYRLVMDNCLEKKIYDRQINKQGMADRVVDECNPDAHLSIKEVTNLCWDNEEETEVRDFSKEKHKYIDVVMQKVLDKHSAVLTKEPFQHESLLVDRKEKKLSQAEKRLAKRSYELEKQANINYNRPQYSYYPSAGVCNSGMQTSLQIRAIRTDGTGNSAVPKPVASVRPMQAELNTQVDRNMRTTAMNSSRSRWIPADVWQRQGMSAQEMTLPLDVVIPTNSPDRASIVLKAGQRVMVLKSPKGIYMQLENGKIIAIRTAFKVGGANKGSSSQDYKNTLVSNVDKSDLEMKPVEIKKEGNPPNINRGNIKVNSVLPLKNNSAITIIPKISPASNMNRSTNVQKPLVNKILPTAIKQEPNLRNWSSNNSHKQLKSLENKISHPRGEAKPYFHLQNHSQQRHCVIDDYEDGDSSDHHQTSIKSYYHHEGDGKGNTNTRSSFSDDASSGTTNLLMDDKDNSNLTENEVIIKTPSPHSFQNTPNRRDDVEQSSETSHDNSPKELDRDPKALSQTHSLGEDSSQSDTGHWPSEKSVPSNFEVNKSHKDGSTGEREFHNFRRHMNMTQVSSNPGAYQPEYVQCEDISKEGHREQQNTSIHEYTEDTVESSKQEVTMSSFSNKNACQLPGNSSQSDKGVGKHSQHFPSTQRSSVTVENSSSSGKNIDDNTALQGSHSLSSLNYPESTMKSPANYQGNNVDTSVNSYSGYKHDSSSSTDTLIQQGKNVNRQYSDSVPVSSDVHCDGRVKSDKGDTHDYDVVRGTNKMKMSEMSNKGVTTNQQYIASVANQSQNNAQLSPDSLSNTKKRQSKTVNIGSELSGDCSGRYNVDLQHMKQFNNGSVPDTQHMSQPVAPVSTPASSSSSSSGNFSSTVTNVSNLTSDNYQVSGTHANSTETHVPDYQQMGNLKATSQTATENVSYSGSYGQYLGGPAYYGFGQQTTPSMVQFSNPYYGDNQYDRPVTSDQGQTNKDRNSSHTVGRPETHSVPVSVPSKKDVGQLNSSDARDLKQDSKSSSHCGRDDTRPAASPGSASGSQSNNNSARSTPAINQTPVSASDTSANCNTSLPASSTVPPTNFNPYSSGSSSSSTGLPTHQNPYESMMLNSYNPATCQYNIPGGNTPGTGGPFSTPPANYSSPLRPTGPTSTVSPYGTPSAYGNSMSYGSGVTPQYDSDYARASMYSAFHRPEPHHFAPAPGELGPPFLPSVPPANPTPFGLPSHHRSHFPSSPGTSSQNSNYYPQNMYAPSPYPTRPSYTAADTAYGVPYSTTATSFNPFLNHHHLHQHPYPPLQHAGPAPPPGPQSTGASPTP